MTALGVLTERMVRDTLRDDLPFAVLAPAGNFIVFNLALRNVIDTGGIGYPQYLLPVIIVQVTLLGALTTVDRAARDHGSELGVRLRSLPIPTVTPLAARMAYCLIRGAIALLAIVIAFTLRRPVTAATRIPFGPFLALGAIEYLLGADALVQEFWRTLTGG